MRNGLPERLFKFAVDVLKFLGTLPSSVQGNVIKYQLAKAASSSGANYEEAQAGSSRADFNGKVDIALREMRESNYWIRMVDALNYGDKNTRKYLLDEPGELKKILGTIAAKTSKQPKSQSPTFSF